MRMCSMQIGHAIVIVVIQTVEGLQIMRIDLGAVIAAQVCCLLPIQRVVEMLQMCHVVAQVLVMRVGVVLLLLLLLLCSVFHGQRRRLLLCNWRSSVCVAIGLETVAAAVQRKTVAAAVAAVVAVTVAVVVCLRFDGNECVGQRRQRWGSCWSCYGGCR